MIVREIKKQEELNSFAASLPVGQFLQSWEWGEFQKAAGRKIFRFGVFDNKQLVGSALVVQQSLPLGKKYWYCPRGPVINFQFPHPSLPEAKPMAGAAITNYQLVLKTLFGAITNEAKRQGTLFIKIEPPVERNQQQSITATLEQYRTRQVSFVQPQDSWYLDVSKPEGELLQAMHHKTRYNIRLAERKGVTVRQGKLEKDFAAFWRLNKATRQRDQFTSHSREYYHDMWKSLPSDFLQLYVAEYQQKIIAANIVIFFGNTATYLHGASADEQRNVMAPHLLQWRQIQAAKKRGLRYYDFWGIAPVGSSKESDWAGITRFKKGFGGEAISYVGTYDLILRKGWYTLYKLAQKIKH